MHVSCDQMQHSADSLQAIFIGDDGQGDVQAALKMASFGPPFVAAFIHQVSDKVQGPSIRSGIADQNTVTVLDRVTLVFL